MTTEYKKTSWLWNAVFWTLVLVYLESVLHGVIFSAISLRYFYLIGFTAVFGLILSAVLGLLPRKANTVITIVLVTALCILYGSQIVYYFIFGTTYSLSMVSLGGDAVTSFWREVLLTMKEHIPALLLVILPIPATFLAWRKTPWLFEPKRGLKAAGVLASGVALHLVMLLTLNIGGTGFYSVYSFYHSSDTTTNQATDCFGLLTTFRLELKNIMFGTEQTENTEYFVELEATEETLVPEYGYNVLDIDFDELNSLTQDEKILALNEYCASLTGTQQNEYTGMLKDYNLIVLCAESFSSAAIDPVLTPTLYQLSTEGIVFNNYYNTFPNTTTDGEYALCMGLLPDSSRGKTAPSFYASRNSYLPMCLGNIFSEQRGVDSYAYHNYLGSYYGRDLTHPNMGYSTCKFAGAGMNFTTSWPASDLEMMEQSVADYIGQEPFHAYYMTFSGHYKYNLSINPMAARNYSQVQDLDYSDPVKCYLSCNIELDKAMAYLMEQLEAAGVADRTAIVLAGDHFPYGLTDDQYDELIGHETDYFERYKDTLIFWVGGLEEPIVVDEYCCNIDVLPTILNLWGFQYDSRLLAGTDVFAKNSPHVAILSDQSFLTDKVWFDANTSSVTYLVDEDTLSPDYVENMIKLVKNKFTVSTDILNSAYYNFVFGESMVRVDTSGWISEEEWNGTGTTDEEEDSDSLAEEIVEDITEAITGQTPEEIIGDITDAITGQTPEEIIGDITDAITGQTPEEIIGDITDAITGQTPEEIIGGITDAITGQAPEENTGESSIPPTE